MDLDLLQRQLAQKLGVDNQTIRNWEANRTNPSHRDMPEVIAFPGYDPFPKPKTFGERLKRYRVIHGVTQRELAKQLRVSPDSIRGWERDEHQSRGKMVQMIEAALR